MNKSGDLPVGPRVPGPGAAERPQPIVHRGVHVHLRQIDVSRDTQFLFDGSHGADQEWIWTYMPYGPFADQQQMRSWLEEISASEDPRFFVVETNADSQPVGIVSYLSIAAEHRCIEVGHIWYVPQVQRSAVNTESIFLLLRHAFEELGYRRVEWKCDALNARSQAAASRLGFRPEGIFRQHRIVRERNRDTAWFSMLDDEWPRIRQHVETWLDADPASRPSLTELTAIIT